MHTRAAQTPDGAERRAGRGRMSAKDMTGELAAGWAPFYAGTTDNNGRPQLRTFGAAADKWAQSGLAPHVPPRMGKSTAAQAQSSETWGIGGTLATGRTRLTPPQSTDIKFDGKKYLVPKESGLHAEGTDMGRKGQVFNAAGVPMRSIRSGAFTIEDTLQRKARVPEEMRTEKRTIHRIAPPGLKGYMGAEYSNDYFKTRDGKTGGAVSAIRMEAPRGEHQLAEPAGGRRTLKSFKQKRDEEDMILTIGGVNSLPDLAFDLLEDDEDMPKPKVDAELVPAE